MNHSQVTPLIDRRDLSNGVLPLVIIVVITSYSVHTEAALVQRASGAGIPRCDN